MRPWLPLASANRRWATPVVAIAICFGGWVPKASGQAPNDRAAFLDEVARTASRLEDPLVAIAEGYRRVGLDFPGMGEHWVNPGLAMAGELDPTRPPVIAYTTVDSQRTLVGLAFTRVLGPEDSPPEGPLPAEAWHDHSDRVDEETLLLSAPASMHATESRFRLAMVHVWVPRDNPDGAFAQNNWTLPFLRAGLAITDHPTPEAARALSLSGNGLDFYKRLLRQGIGLRGDELRTAVGVFEDAGRWAREWIDGRQDRATVRSQDLAELEGLWAQLWVDLRAALSAEAYDKVAVLGPGG